MNIVQLTPGAGSMYCGNCLRDNALVAAYRRQGHEVMMVPLYLPLTLDETDHSAGTPIFFGGVNVFLDQKAALFRSAPEFLRRWLASPTLLRWTGKFAAKTRAEDVADLTLSMLRGEDGNQARDLDEFIAWLRTQPKPDVVCLSNALLLGMVRRVKAETGAKIVCLLAGEDSYLDAMHDPLRSQVWRTLAERAREVDGFVAPSRYFGERMRDRLGVGADRIHVVPPGLNLDGFPQPGPTTADPTHRSGPPTLGYFTRMSPDKGLGTLVDAFITLKHRQRVPGLRLKVGGGCGPGDEAFVAGLRTRLHEAGFLGDVDFQPNLDRRAKIDFLRSVTLFSVPALYGEAFGLYLLEAMAAGTPVVQPRHAGFPEVVEDTGGGLLCEPGSATALADAIEGLLLDPERRRQFAQAGFTAVHERYHADAVANRMIEVFSELALHSGVARRG